MKEYIDKSDVNGLVQIGWSGDAIVTAIINDGISSVPAITLDKVKQARAEIEDKIYNYPDRNISEYEDCLAILDKLIESEE